MKINWFRLYKSIFFTAVVALMHIQLAISETVYKSVDAEGNVTFSSEPPADATEVQEVAVPKSNSVSDGESVEEINKKADALARENREQEKEIEQSKNESAPGEIIVEDQPVYTAPRPIIENRPISNPPGAVRPPVVRPSPGRAR